MRESERERGRLEQKEESKSPRMSPNCEIHVRSLCFLIFFLARAAFSEKIAFSFAHFLVPRMPPKVKLSLDFPLPSAAGMGPSLPLSMPALPSVSLCEAFTPTPSASKQHAVVWLPQCPLGGKCQYDGATMSLSKHLIKNHKVRTRSKAPANAQRCRG